MSLLKRNIGCLTFLMELKNKSLKEIQGNTSIPSTYSFSDNKDTLEIGLLITEFITGSGVEETMLIQCQDTNEDKSVELWCSNNGFYIKFLSNISKDESKVVKTVKADLFICEFSQQEEFHLYLSDFLQTYDIWVSGQIPKVIQTEPEHRDIALVQLLTDRLAGSEVKMENMFEKMETLETEVQNLKQCTIQLLGLVERMSSGRKQSV